jgi:hypothetical protein
MRAYESHIGNAIHTHNSLDAAVADIEAAGSGLLLSLAGNHNLPGLLPEIEWRTGAGWTFERGTWYAVELHGGGNGRWPAHPLGDPSGRRLAEST